jgi:hypothetical protein
VLFAERVWLGVALGGFLVCPVAQVSWAIAFGSAVGSTLQAIVDATLRRCPKPANSNTASPDSPFNCCRSNTIKAGVEKFNC